MFGVRSAHASSVDCDGWLHEALCCVKVHFGAVNHNQHAGSTVVGMRSAHASSVDCDGWLHEALCCVKVH